MATIRTLIVEGNNTHFWVWTGPRTVVSPSFGQNLEPFFLPLTVFSKYYSKSGSALAWLGSAAAAAVTVAAAAPSGESVTAMRHKAFSLGVLFKVLWPSSPTFSTAYCNGFFGFWFGRDPLLPLQCWPTRPSRKAGRPSLLRCTKRTSIVGQCEAVEAAQLL